MESKDSRVSVPILYDRRLMYEQRARSNSVEINRQERAASKIQAWSRGTSARRRYRMEASSHELPRQVSLPIMYEKRIAYEQRARADADERNRREQSATKIQAWSRGTSARQQTRVWILMQRRHSAQTNLNRAQSAPSAGAKVGSAVRDRAESSPALTGEAWLRQLELKTASPAGVCEFWLRGEESAVAPGSQLQTDPLPEPQERRLSHEWREIMAKRVRGRRGKGSPGAKLKRMSGKYPQGTNQHLQADKTTHLGQA